MSGDGVTAFIEMAAASGLGLVPPDKRNPLITTSRGTGELILQALKHGAERIIIGIGGSATNDGGAGMMQALGARLCDAEGQEIGHGGGSLSRLSRIDLSAIDPRLRDRMIHVAWRCYQSAGGRAWGVADLWPTERGDRGDDRRAGS